MKLLKAGLVCLLLMGGSAVFFGYALPAIIHWAAFLLTQNVGG